MDYLVKLDIPVFLAHGTDDDSSPIESADAIADEFATRGKENLTYRRLDTNHSFTGPDGTSHFNDVLAQVMQWARAHNLLP